MPDNRHIVDVICTHLHVAVLPWYNFCIVLQIDQCRYLIIVVRYKIEMYVNIQSIDAIYMHLFQFIYVSSRYTFHGHVIPSFISNELWPSGYDGGLVRWRQCRVRGSNPSMDKIFSNIHFSMLPAAGLTAFKWNQTWHSSEVLGA